MSTSATERQLETGIRLIKEAFSRQVGSINSSMVLHQSNEINRLEKELNHKNRIIQDLKDEVDQLQHDCEERENRLNHLTNSLTRYQDLKNVILHTVNHVEEHEPTSSTHINEIGESFLTSAPMLHSGTPSAMGMDAPNLTVPNDTGPFFKPEAPPRPSPAYESYPNPLSKPYAGDPFRPQGSPLLASTPVPRNPRVHFQHPSPRQETVFAGDEFVDSTGSSTQPASQYRSDRPVYSEEAAVFFQHAKAHLTYNEVSSLLRRSTHAYC
ncbi:hypothetical protein IWQ62_002353 [Dispira parvispora]|uniref:Uncharacterized protein n=1 Tax=Dispira parvispora TaxID=1520584 RepID=A0A9W8ATZ6_9FUNG|nr:hypothetical protein IWQ62_002353 [Dispira parvispora]